LYYNDTKLNTTDSLACRWVERKSGCYIVSLEFHVEATQELVQAFTAAGFEICRAVSEAAAAAVALEATEHTQGTVFILDMGGGTFDACLAILGDGIIEIIDVYGDRELGGRDFDEAHRSLVNIKIDSLNATAQGKYWLPQCSAYDEQIEKIKFQINTTESSSTTYARASGPPKCGVQKREQRGKVAARLG
jgi:molecular chaperone DnaK (HSP70)